MAANLADCDYRVQVDDESSLFFCRHVRVKAPESLVRPSICRLCNRRAEQCSTLRPVPVQPLRLPSPPLGDGGEAEYISTEQLVADTRKLIGKLPSDVTAVAGIPRSGMLPASIIAAYLHLPLYELCAKQGLRQIGHGLRLGRSDIPAGKIVVVDDSVYSGYVMRKVRPHLESIPSLLAALYPRPETAQVVDLYARLAPAPHLFEWNLFNCNQTSRFAFDFDGILCQDWGGGNEEGEAYRTFLQTAQPRWLPRRSEIPLIVTARLEKHRAYTMAWLNAHRVRVKRLVMGPWNTVAERRRADVGEFKGLAYARSRCSLFIESDKRQAARIHEVSAKPVLCPEAECVFQ